MVTEEWCMERLHHYHNIMGIEMPPVDKIFFYQKDWADHIAHTVKRKREIMSGTLLGSNRESGMALFINLDRDDSMKNVENTIVHETMHTKYTNLNHGLRYSTYCWQISHGKYPPSYNPIKAVYHWLVEEYI